MIAVTFDTERKLVRAVMGGMLTPADVEQFSRDEQQAVKAMGLHSGEFDLLVETVGNLVQTQAVTDAFQELIRNSPVKAARIAIVRDGALTRMQSRRISRERTLAEVFGTLAEAEAWLAA